MDEPSLIGIRRRIDRAQSKLDDLNAEVGPWIKDESNELRGEVHPDTGKFVGYIDLRGEPPIDWSIEVGEIVHNLRASLDSLVWLMVPRRRRTIRTCFPIHTDPDEFACAVTLPARKRRPGPLTGLDPASAPFAFIEAAQPYNGPHGAEYHPLFIIRELSNEDKHRTILARTIGIPTSDGKPVINFFTNDLEVIRESVWLKVDGPVIQGAPVMGGDVQITGKNPQMKVEAGLPLSVAFGKPMLVVSGLAQVVQETRRLIEAIAKIA
ncbi:MAG: hypothetical protein ABSC56_05715 [Solirubrobacteraceae bacterium]